ncbi:HNH endonuclease family protein [Ruania albidiflava]|uniref:HNH endonuclease family protein n=1 Tax=Ruania albidiflava TaxID=366586 RepID=UPI000A03AB03|nr:HNH endonuclease family protein [Ruania albidiflava]
MPVRSPARLLVTGAVAAVLVLAVALLLPRWWQHVRQAPPWPVPAGHLERARAALPTLTVRAPLPLADYDRDFFGPPWADVDGNGCDTRNDVLRSWLTDVHLDPVVPCVVVSGTLTDPYTGHLVEFRRGPQTSTAVQIDHVVALADAWRKGAAEWPASLALQFANDPANLIPVDGQVNQDKQADDAASWLPPDAGFHCAYVVQQVLVKDAYGLGVSAEEVGALGEVLATCRSGEGNAAGCQRAPIASILRAAGQPVDRPVVQHRSRRTRVPGGRHPGLQRQRPDPGPGLRVRAAVAAGREARAPPPARGRRSDAGARRPARGCARGPRPGRLPGPVRRRGGGGPAAGRLRRSEPARAR